MSVTQGVTRGEAGGRAGPDACVCRGTFCSHAPRTAFQPPRRSPCAPETCQCAGVACVNSLLGSSACVLDGWARRRRCGACVPGGLARAVWSARRSSLWGRCGSRGRCGKKGRARGVTHAGLREPASGFCDALGARCAAPAALLRCESQFPSDACAACAKANERAARGSQGMARALGCGQAGRCNDTFEARRLGGRGRKGHFPRRLLSLDTLSDAALLLQWRVF